MATFTNLGKTFREETDFLFSDGTDFLFSDDTDFVFIEGESLPVTNQTKNVSTMKMYAKGGSGIPYDSDALYDGEFDPISGNPLLYDTAGTTPVWSNMAKA